ncbi:MAG: Sec-independent protein translocase subunit TatA/TatB [Acidimicrobiales bacterium]
MPDLSPLKLLIIFIVVVILLGPHRLPEVARQLGAGWQWVRDVHQRMDQEIRKNVPDLPASQDLARLARSPVSLLNELASMPAADRDAPVVDPGAPPAPMPPPAGTAAGPGRPLLPLQPSDDPGMN